MFPRLLVWQLFFLPQGETQRLLVLIDYLFCLFFLSRLPSLRFTEPNTSGIMYSPGIARFGLFRTGRTRTSIPSISTYCSRPDGDSFLPNSHQGRRPGQYRIHGYRHDVGGFA